MAGAGGNTSESALWDVLSKALAAVAGGVTLIGFVTAVGGSILWSRFDSAGLPGDPSAALVSKGELVATGLSTLIPFVAGAALTLLLLYLIDPTATVASAGEEPADDSARRAPVPGTAKRARMAKSFSTAFRDAWLRGLLLAGLELVFYAIATRHPADRTLWVLAIVVALGGALISLAVAARTVGFRWFGLTAFAAIAGFGAVMTYADTERHPQARPGAVVLKDGRSFSGVYVAQTEDRIYLGLVRPSDAAPSDPDLCRGEDSPFQPQSGRIVSFPRDQVDSFALGRLRTRCKALYSAVALRDELLRKLPPPPKPAPGGAP